MLDHSVWKDLCYRWRSIKQRRKRRPIDPKFWNQASKIGCLASTKRPTIFSKIVMISASPMYLILCIFVRISLSRILISSTLHCLVVNSMITPNRHIESMPTTIILRFSCNLLVLCFIIVKHHTRHTWLWMLNDSWAICQAREIYKAAENFLGFSQVPDLVHLCPSVIFIILHHQHCFLIDSITSNYNIDLMLTAKHKVVIVIVWFCVHRCETKWVQLYKFN